LAVHFGAAAERKAIEPLVRAPSAEHRLHGGKPLPIRLASCWRIDARLPARGVRGPSVSVRPCTNATLRTGVVSGVRRHCARSGHGPQSRFVRRKCAPTYWQWAFAIQLGVSFPRLNEVINAKRSVTPDTALRLTQVTGMSADFWLGLQQDWDLWHALRSKEAGRIAHLKPLSRSG